MWLRKKLNFDCKIIVKTPVDRLNSCYEYWKNANASEYILDVVNNEYKLPFRDVPRSVILPNNKSANDNCLFVSSEIESVLTKGCISQVNKSPVVVNPLTVAYGKSGKPRLVLDCRYINPELFKFNGIEI